MRVKKLRHIGCEHLTHIQLWLCVMKLSLHHRGRRAEPQRITEKTIQLSVILCVISVPLW